MRVLHVGSSLDPRTGGPAVALAGLTRAQARAGLEVAILVTYPNGADLSAVRTLESLGVKVQAVGPVTGPLSRHPGLAAAAVQSVGAADVVHIHALWEEVQHQAARAARRRGTPYLIRPCGMLDPWSLAQSRWKKKIYMAWRLRRDLNAAAALHFTARAEMDLTRPLRLKAPGMVEPNGLDLAEFERLPEPGEFRRRYPQIGDRPVVLFMSRIHPKKGLDLLVPAFARSAHRDAVLVIAGPDSDGYRAEVEKRAESEGIAGRVIFPGMLWHADRIGALADADLFALPSRQENFGIAVVEALAAGTPVVISDQVNIHHEITSRGVGGVVPLDTTRLTAEIDRWLGDRNRLESAGRQARSFVRDHYDWNQIAARWAGHYERIARGKPVAPANDLRTAS